MLGLVKKALRMMTDAFDDELLVLILGGIKDLLLTGITFEWSEVKSDDVVTDYSIDDVLVKRAVTTYCRCHFGQPDEYDRLKRAYDEQKAQLMSSHDYWE